MTSSSLPITASMPIALWAAIPAEISKVLIRFTLTRLCSYTIYSVVKYHLVLPPERRKSSFLAASSWLLERKPY